MIHKTPPTIQQFHVSRKIRLKNSRHNPGKYLIFYDTLSRAKLKEQTPQMSQTDINCQVHSLISSSPIRTERLKQVQTETLYDNALQRVASYIAQR